MNQAEFQQHLATRIKIFGQGKCLNRIIPLCKRYFAEKKISEISINEFSKISGLTIELSKEVLIKINSDIFKQKQQAKF